MNLTVESIEVIELEDEVEVWDIEVPETENFKLSSGPFVHNSKDLADAVCGSVWLAKKHMHRLRADMTTESVIDQLKAVGSSRYDNILRGSR